MVGKSSLAKFAFKTVSQSNRGKAEAAVWGALGGGARQGSEPKVILSSCEPRLPTDATAEADC